MKGQAIDQKVSFSKVFCLKTIKYKVRLIIKPNQSFRNQINNSRELVWDNYPSHNEESNTIHGWMLCHTMSSNPMKMKQKQQSNIIFLCAFANEIISSCRVDRQFYVLSHKLMCLDVLPTQPWIGLWCWRWWWWSKAKSHWKVKHFRTQSNGITLNKSVE